MVWWNWYTFLHLFVTIFRGFVAVFIMLSARALPGRGNLGEDLLYIAADAAKKLRGVFALPNLENLPNRKKNG